MFSPAHTPAPDRRRFLIASSLATAVGALPAWARATESLAHNPFTLGVASGDPEPDNILIWTRLTAPLDYLGTAVAPDLAAQTVHWEVAHDAQCRQTVAHGQIQARAEWGHAVHVQVNGLSPDRWYFYRFRCGDAFSTTARCRTAPAAGADVRRLRCIAVVIFCAQCLASFVFWKAGLSGKAAFYLTYLCPVFRAGDFTISCCMGCLYHSRKQESGLPGGAFSLLELAAVLLAGGCLFIAAKQVGVLGAVAFRYNVLFTPSAVLLVWLLAVGKGIISRLLSAKPFLWLAGLSPYGFLIHQVLIRYMEWTADKFSLTVHPVVWTLTVYLLTLCLSSFYKALEHRVRQRLAKQ